MQVYVASSMYFRKREKKITISLFILKCSLTLSLLETPIVVYFSITIVLIFDDKNRRTRRKQLIDSLVLIYFNPVCTLAKGCQIFLDATYQNEGKYTQFPNITKSP
jgi:hypothetical protein